MPKEERKELWDVDALLQSYRKIPDWKKQIEGQYAAITKFLVDNGLLKPKKKAIDKDGKLILRVVYIDELTTEGFDFLKLAGNAWFKSKASLKDPTKIALLEKKLKEVRGK